MRVSENKIKFLGHEVDASGIHTQADKVEAVNKFPGPKTVNNVRSFLGLAGYYRSFIRNFSSIAAPLNNLLKRIALFIGTPLNRKVLRSCSGRSPLPPSCGFLITSNLSRCIQMRLYKGLELF